MSTTYEYRFVRIGEYVGSERIVREHARDGWQLVQICAPGITAFGAAKYYELIFAREMPATAMPSARENDREPVSV